MNQPTSSPIVPIVSALIASGSFAFAIFTYFRTRKFAELRYEITELSDFKIPAAFVQQLGYAPIAVRIESTGNKAAENVFLDLTTTNQIEKYEIEPETFVPAKKPRGNGVQLSIEKLNPAQTLRIFIICSGNPIEKQLGRTSTHSAREAGLTSTISDLNRRLSD